MKAPPLVEEDALRAFEDDVAGSVQLALHEVSVHDRGFARELRVRRDYGVHDVRIFEHEEFLEMRGECLSRSASRSISERFRSWMRKSFRLSAGLSLSKSRAQTVSLPSTRSSIVSPMPMPQLPCTLPLAACRASSRHRFAATWKGVVMGAFRSTKSCA